MITLVWCSSSELFGSKATRCIQISLEAVNICKQIFWIQQIRSSFISLREFIESAFYGIVYYCTTQIHVCLYHILVWCKMFTCICLLPSGVSYYFPATVLFQLLITVIIFKLLSYPFSFSYSYYWVTSNECRALVKLSYYLYLKYLILLEYFVRSYILCNQHFTTKKFFSLTKYRIISIFQLLYSSVLEIQKSSFGKY
jgi:hypothetical protein